MFAQNRGIANKENFEIQINNGNILLYVHNVKFDSATMSSCCPALLPGIPAT